MANDSNQPNSSPWSRRFLVLGHRTPRIRLVTDGALIALVLLPLNLPEPIWFICWATCTVSMLFLHGVGFYHDRQLCDLCFDEMALNPSEQAEKHITALRWNHHLVSRWFLPSFLISVFTLPSLFRSTLPYTWLDSAYRLEVAAAIAIGLIMVRVQALHHRLQPWCPICGDDDDGGGGKAIDPNPDPSRQSNLTPTQ